MAEINSTLQIGDFQIKNRLVMAPLTRARSDDTRIPNDLMLEYYKQRATAGLIITEAAVISPKAAGYKDSPGLWTEEQALAWKKIVDEVHQQGAKIMVQLWHVGRISHPDIVDGVQPIAPSAIPAKGHVNLLRPKRPYVMPRALSVEEIHEIIQQYKDAAELAKIAGFDGVELHAANGYLPDQFLQSSTNVRTDIYGGSIENRARFLLEVVDALTEVWGSGRVGVHLAPRGDSLDMGDDTPLETFGYVVEQLSERNIAFVFLREYLAEDSISHKLRKKFNGAWIANEDLTPELAKKILAEGQADAVSFGKAYIANPDLFYRIVNDLPLNELNTSTMYAKGPLGYTDYPTYKELTAEA